MGSISINNDDPISYHALNGHSMDIKIDPDLDHHDEFLCDDDDDIKKGLQVHVGKQKSHRYQSRGIIYFQTGYYDDKQMKNISSAWSHDIKHGPLILFGDNYSDKKRPKHLSRKKYAGQSKIMGKYDRSFGFGIPTTFDDAKERGFNFSDKNFKKLIHNEFKKLHKHLQLVVILLYHFQIIKIYKTDQINILKMVIMIIQNK